MLKANAGCTGKGGCTLVCMCEVTACVMHPSATGLIGMACKLCVASGVLQSATLQCIMCFQPTTANRHSHLLTAFAPTAQLQHALLLVRLHYATSRYPFVVRSSKAGSLRQVMGRVCCAGPMRGFGEWDAERVCNWQQPANCFAKHRWVAVAGNVCNRSCATYFTRHNEKAFPSCCTGLETKLGKGVTWSLKQEATLQAENNFQLCEHIFAAYSR